MATVAANLAIAVGGQLLFSLFAPKPPTLEGSRLADLNIPAVSPGNPVVRAWGAMKVPGQVIYCPGLKQTKHTKKVKGGKGGSKKQTQITYTYSTTAAVACGEGELTIERVWGNSKLIWQAPEFDEVDYATAVANYTVERTAFWTTYYGTGFWLNFYSPAQRADLVQNKVDQDVANYASLNDPATERPEFASMTVYTGSETQTADSVLEAELGVGNVPAYRGTAYFVIEDLQLADFGRAIPQFTVQVRDREGNVSMYDIVNDLCTEAGLVLDDTFSITDELRIMEVQGFALTQLTSARSAIELLTRIFPFDGREVGDKIEFLGRDRSPIGVIDWNDLRTRPSDNAQTESRIKRTRVDDLQLPRSIRMSYQDVNRDYSKNSAKSTRQVSQSNQVDTRDIPVSSDPITMKKAAETAMAQVIAGRNGYEVKLPLKYLSFKPGDIIRLPTSAQGDYKTVRVSTRDIGKNFILDMKLVDHVSSEVGIMSVADDSVFTAAALTAAATTQTYVLDTPSLDDTEVESGVYVAFGPTTTNWPGAGVFRDTDASESTPVFGEDLSDNSGTNWLLELVGDEPSAAGFSIGALEAAESFIVDSASTLYVEFQTPNPIFTSQTLAQAASSTDNVFLVGDELVQALTVQQLDTQNYIFTDLIRGLRGTDWAAYSHVAGERVVAIDEDAVARWDLSLELKEQLIEYRGVTDGNDVLSVATESFTYDAAYLRAFAPSVANVNRNTAGDLTFTLEPRARYTGEWLNGSGTSSTEGDPADEQFVVLIYDMPAYQGGATLLRTVTLDGTRDFTYTAAEQTTDFGSTQSSIDFLITQTSGVDARAGFPRYVTL